MKEVEVRLTVHAPDHLTFSETAEMIWDKLDRPGSVLTVCAIAAGQQLWPCEENMPCAHAKNEGAP